MRIQIENDGEFLPPGVLEKVVASVSTSLNSIGTAGGKFVVNDTICYREQRTGKITNCVMNSATFLSKKFQAKLDEMDHCRGETKISGQSIDGFLSVQYQGPAYQIKDKNLLLEVIHGYIGDNGLPDSIVYTLFPKFYGMFVDRALFDVSHLPKRYQSYFEVSDANAEFRVGVEFETGNIASSFRAINKLFVLFQHGFIDAGVLVTSIDKKSSATRIWPTSNRNGSFEELRQRDYESQVSLPLVSVGFAPDEFSEDASFLGKNGDLYLPGPTGRKHETGLYEIFLGEDGEEILMPV